jgi:WD40 repeat protein
MKKTYLLAVVFIVSCLKIYAQKEANNWYFGTNAGLSFNGVNPIAIVGGADVTLDNSSSISDSAGNVLFYTNGVTVWNKNNATMFNGTGLLGNVSGGQSTLIVPQPKSTKIYYIFSLDGEAGPNGLHYSVVDMSQQAGLGAVTTKNVLMYTPTTEKIDATYNQTTDSYWVLTHDWNNNNFKAYNLSSSGLDTTAVVSSVGSVNAGGSPYGYDAMGQMTFSPDGSKIASAIYSDGKIELFNFDISTGIVSSPITITGYPNAWGTAFSPDGTKLYATVWFTEPVYQFDLSTYVLSNIMASVTIVGYASGSSGYNAGYLQIGPDNKIYLARVYADSLAVINTPDSLGAKCNFVNNGISIAPGSCVAGLSRVPFKRIISEEGINEIKSNTEVNLYPNPNDGTFSVNINTSNKAYQIAIYNVLGEKIYQARLNNGITKLKLDNQSHGIYSYNVVTNDTGITLKTGKFVIE